MSNEAEQSSLAPTPKQGAGGFAVAALLLAGGVLLVYWRLLLTNRVLGSGDAFAYFTPYRDYANAMLRSGRLPLWNPYLFLGVPFLANPQSAVLYPLHWPFIGLPAAKSLIASLALHLWLAGLGAFIYARRVVGLAFLPALVTGLVFGLSGYLGAHAGQVNQVSVAAWLPWLLWLLEAVISDRSSVNSEQWRRATREELWTSDRWSPVRGHHLNLVAWAGLSLVVALQLLAGHTQASYINLVGLGLAAIWPGLAALVAWGAARLQRRPTTPERGAIAWAAGRLGLATAAGLAGGLLAAVQLLPTWELAQRSVRSGGLPYREVVSFSLRPRGLLLSLLPGYGENLAGHYGTPAFAEFVAYVGVSALILAGLAVILAGRRRPPGAGLLRSPVGLGLAFVIVGLGLGLGVFNPLYYVLYRLVPGFDLFRAPARWMVLYTFGVALLAGIGLQEAGSRESGAGGSREFVGYVRVARRKCNLLALVLGGGALAVFLAWQRWPAIWVVGLWLAAGAATLWLVTWPGRRRHWVAPLLLVLLLAELVGGSLSLDHTQPTAPEAVTSLRTAPAHLLAVARTQQAAGQIPGRFLSMSGITYDPGDLAEIEQMLAGRLPEQAIYDFVVASKLQEIVAPNLPLLWRLPAVDGYDGGVLPLRRYVDLQTLFVPPEQLAPDGRLREQLQAVPASRLLRLLGIDHVITDKVFDVWMDDVYYDLELSTVLEAGQTVDVDSAGRLEATEIGVFTHLLDAMDLPAGTPVAEVVVESEDSHQRFVLRAGKETAEGAWSDGAAHPQPAARQPWPRHQAGWDYLARLPLDWPLSPQRVAVTNIAPRGNVVLRGISLIDGRTGTHAALTIPADGNFRRVHSGDVKVYQNLAALPRAYLVGQVQVVADEQAALAALADPNFDPAERVILLREDLLATNQAESVADVNTSQIDAAVVVDAYEAERVDLRVTLPAPGILVLSDTWYPGWQATVDGRATPILHANLLFRALLVPAGSHQVVMRYRPRSLHVGAGVSATAALLLASLTAWDLARRGRQRAAADY